MIPTILKFEYKIKMHAKILEFLQVNRLTGRQGEANMWNLQVFVGNQNHNKDNTVTGISRKNMYGQDERFPHQTILSVSKQTNIFVDIIYWISTQDKQPHIMKICVFLKGKHINLENAFVWKFTAQ